MKKISFVLLLAVCAPASALAQEAFAPESLAGGIFIVTITSGNGLFSSSGRYLFETTDQGTAYQVTALTDEVENSSGAYSYTKTGPNTATISAEDSSVGVAIAQTLVFSSATTGAFTIENDFGSQSVTFSAYVPQTQPFTTNGWTYNDAYPWVFSPTHGWLYFVPTDFGIWVQKHQTGEWIFKR